MMKWPTVKSLRQLCERNPHKHRFLSQTPMATNTEHVLHNCNCCQYFPSMSAFLPKSHSLQLCYSTICAECQRILCILPYLFVFSTSTYFEAQALSHRDIPVVLHTKADSCSSGLCRCGAEEQGLYIGLFPGKKIAVDWSSYCLLHLGNFSPTWEQTDQHRALKEIICFLNR